MHRYLALIAITFSLCSCLTLSGCGGEPKNEVLTEGEVEDANAAYEAEQAAEAEKAAREAASGS